jgi:hypothetical protein
MKYNQAELRRIVTQRIEELEVDPEKILFDPVALQCAEEIMKARRSEIDNWAQRWDEWSIRQKRFLQWGGQYRLDSRNPETFNEYVTMIQREYWNKTELRDLVWNKLTVKKIITDLVGPQHVAELYGAYKTIEEIQSPAVWNNLPDQFVVKGVLGCSGMYVRIIDKRQPETIATLHDWDPPHTLYRAPYKSKCSEEQWIVEELLISPTPGNTVEEYKFYSTYGHIIWVGACTDKYHLGEQGPFTKKHSMYTIPTWQQVPATYMGCAPHTPPIPPDIEHMISITKRIATPHPLSRIDLMKGDTPQGERKIVVGEITTRINGGWAVWNPPRVDHLMGQVVKARAGPPPDPRPAAPLRQEYPRAAGISPLCVWAPGPPERQGMRH